MSQLEEYRDQIDAVDKELVALFRRRMDITAKVGQYKLERQMPVLDAARERRVMEARTAMVDDAALKADVAKLYGIYPQKGAIAVGSDADLILVEPCEPYPLTIAGLHEKTDYTPFEGWPLTARIRMTLARGCVVAEDGVFTGRRGAGRLLRRGLPAALGEL